MTRTGLPAHILPLSRFRGVFVGSLPVLGPIFTVWTCLVPSGYIFAENAGKMRNLRRLALFRVVFGSGPWRIHRWHLFKIE